jgi:hypothetical protein
VNSGYSAARVEEFAMNDDRRTDRRVGLQRPCWIVTGPDSAPREGQIRDVSEMGAMIMVDKPDQVPDIFILLLSQIGNSARKCKVVRRTEKELGLQFIGKIYRKDAEIAVVDDAV